MHFFSLSLLRSIALWLPRRGCSSQSVSFTSKKPSAAICSTGRFGRLLCKAKYNSRMWEATNGHSRAQAIDAARCLMFVDHAWPALVTAGGFGGSAGLAFCMLSASLCSLEHLLWKPWRMAPFRQRLLAADPRLEIAQMLMRIRPCLLDHFSRDFLSFFDSPEDLLAHGYQHLIVMGGVLRHDIARIECRHAAVRRIARAKGQAYSAEVMRSSAEFFLAQQRVLEQKYDFGQEEKRVEEEPPQRRFLRSKKKGKQQGGGGGLQRRIVGMYLKGRTYKTKEERSAAMRAASQRYQEV